MPTLITRGVASAKAFGLTGTNKGQLYTVLFTSSGTFTTMPGLTTISQLTGQGQASSGDYQTTSGQLRYSFAQSLGGAGPGGFVLPFQWSGLYDKAAAVVSTLNSGGDHSIDPLYAERYDLYNTPYAQWDPESLGIEFFPYWTVAGTWSVGNTGNAPLPAVGDGNYGVNGGYYAQGDYIAPGSAGANTTALGYTFNGASLVGSYPNRTGQAAAVTTYNNVSVTPATEYPIVVAPGGYVQLTFIGP